MAIEADLSEMVKKLEELEEKKKRAHTALSELGDNSLAVGHSLEKLDIKGIKSNREFCPIAKYLQTKGFVQAHVGITMACIGGSLWIRLPRHITEFIRDFDGGDYAQLEG